MLQIYYIITQDQQVEQHAKNCTCEKYCSRHSYLN